MWDIFRVTPSPWINAEADEMKWPQLKWSLCYVLNWTSFVIGSVPALWRLVLTPHKKCTAVQNYHLNEKLLCILSFVFFVQTSLSTTMSGIKLQCDDFGSNYNENVNDMSQFSCCFLSLNFLCIFVCSTLIVPFNNFWLDLTNLPPFFCFSACPLLFNTFWCRHLVRALFGLCLHVTCSFRRINLILYNWYFESAYWESISGWCRIPNTSIHQYGKSYDVRAVASGTNMTATDCVVPWNCKAEEKRWQFWHQANNSDRLSYSHLETGNTFPQSFIYCSVVLVNVFQTKTWLIFLFTCQRLSCTDRLVAWSTRNIIFWVGIVCM